MMLVWLRLGRQILRHETNLRVWPHPAFEIGVEDAVKNRPIINRLPVRFLAMRAGRTPFQRRRPVAGRQQIVRAKINLLWREVPEFADELLAMLHVSIVRLIRAKEPPDRFQFAARLRGIDANRHRESCLRLVG
jgi:hypothetical protein